VVDNSHKTLLHPKRNRENMKQSAIFKKEPQQIAFTLIASSLLCLICACAHAQDADVLTTDRPDFVESSDVVGKGRFQIETSVAIERDQANFRKDRTLTTPTLLRFGVSDTVELRLETEGRTLYKSENSLTGATFETRGYSDLSAGLKWHVQDGHGGSPSIAWLLHADLDSGSAPFQGNGIRPSLRLVTEWELPNDFSLGVMPGIIYDKTDDGQRFYNGVFGVVLGKAWNTRFRTFVEIAAPQIASAKYGGSMATFDVGAAYLLSNLCQIDLAYYRGINENAPDSRWSIGLSKKF
jgi:hypothetical protein